MISRGALEYVLPAPAVESRVPILNCVVCFANAGMLAFAFLRAGLWLSRAALKGHKKYKDSTHVDFSHPPLTVPSSQV